MSIYTIIVKSRYRSTTNTNVVWVRVRGFTSPYLTGSNQAKD